MKTLVKALLLTTALACVASAAFAVSGNIRISVVYGGGGGSSLTATYNQDYIELYNSSSSAVNIGGWALEYGSATGNWGSSAGNYLVFAPNTIIPPCSYVSIASGTVGTNSPPLP